MTAIAWFLVTGALLVLLAVSGSVFQRLPLSVAMVYLMAGVLIGPAVLDLFYVDPVGQAALLERITEVAVIISLFSAGLKLRTPLADRRWQVPVRLAFVSMTVTVGLIAAAGVWGMGLPLGAAVLLGAVLAPTDPVLASDVQVEHPTDRDRLRFSLTGEAGLNDGTAFPFVMLGLGLLGLHEMGEWGWRWLAVDVLWAIVGGLAVGTAMGMAVGRFILYLRSEHKEAVGLDDFLGLGLIALSYGTALLVHTYGFLAVFAAGLALRRIERKHTGEHRPPPDVELAAEAEDVVEVATDPEKAPAYMAQAVLAFSEQLERIGTVGVVVLLGGMLSQSYLSVHVFWFVPLLFLVIRPVAVVVGLAGSDTSPARRRLISWFGIRGIGSVYYLTFAIEHGVPGDVAERLTAVMLATVVASIFLHGVTVTPLMRRYTRESRDED
ncbi:MAG TPA: sodium:proton antiporter [Longimicrobiaceae bacterium]|nr:sodium:proton antiporter [Longimicrobiaceae bacterium]